MHILTSPNLPTGNYVLNYAHHKNKFKTKMSREKVETKSGLGFRNSVYEEIRRTYLIGEYYQTLKRIQRNHNSHEHFYIVNNDADIFEEVTYQSKNIQIEPTIELKITSQSSIENNEKPTVKEQYGMKIIDLLNSKNVKKK